MPDRVSVPEEAIEAFLRARDSAEYANTLAGLRAAAPLILAPMLAEFVDDLEALHADGGEIDELTAKWRARVGVLRGDQT